MDPLHKPQISTWTQAHLDLFGESSPINSPCQVAKKSPHSNMAGVDVQQMWWRISISTITRDRDMLVGEMKRLDLSRKREPEGTVSQQHV